MSTHLIELLQNLPQTRVALVGDLMLDRYVYGNAERLSPEAPVPVLHFHHEDLRVGGAGSVAANLIALGAKVRVVGLVGDDDAGRIVSDQLLQAGVDVKGLLNTVDRPTVCKMRLVGLAQHRHPQQMIRLDFEDASPVDESVASEVVTAVEAALGDAQVLCIEDYNKGLLTPLVCRQIIAVARARDVPVFVDPAYVADYSKYAGATVLKMNRTEAERATKLPVENEAQYEMASQWLLENLDLEAVVITLDKHGAYLATRDGQRQWLRTKQRQVYDVTGAGDMVLAMLTAARGAGASWPDAVVLANVAGGLEVERFGAVPVAPQEIINELLSEMHDHFGKLRTLEKLQIELRHHRAAGRKIVFTNGCFDLIHLGHVKYFQFAKAQGDMLVVAVNTDASIRRLKGEKRPIVNESDRLGVLEELESIDYLITFDDDTPMRLIEAIEPDVLVKGADYKKEEVVGWEVVEKRGGQVVLAQLIDGKSTSAVIQRILDAYRP